MQKNEILKLQYDRLDQIANKLSKLADSERNYHMFKTARKKPDFKNHPDYIKVKSNYF